MGNYNASGNPSQGRTLLTGATGFIGSSLAARFLADGKRVVALSRRDPAGIKTRSAILRASRTLGLQLPEALIKERLQVISAPIEEATKALETESLDDIEAVWHLAALLSYDMGRLNESLDTNVAAAADLYRTVSTRATRCRRFYHVSTAYTVGFPPVGTPIPEDLHPAPYHPNVYQLTKWSAEMSLRALSVDSRLPVTILRPSVVVGHSSSGAYHGDPFGIYMFLLAGQKLLSTLGITELHLDPRTNGSIDLVPIDSLVANWTELARREGPFRPAFEVIHCTGTAVSAEKVARAGAAVSGIRITFDGPMTEMDRDFARAVEDNQIFASHTFPFEEGRLAAILGNQRVPVNVDDAMLVRLIRHYLERLGTEPQPTSMNPADADRSESREGDKQP